MSFIKQIEKNIPTSPSEDIDWKNIEALLSATCFADMKNTQQNPIFHGEGDVYTHTQMVCRELVKNSAFYELQPRLKIELFLAALLHDIGKVKTTKLEEGKWISPNHSFVGSKIAREFLWRDCGLCGSKEKIIFRETVCALVRYHMLPVHLLGMEELERKVREAAAVGELAADFSWKLLCMLAEADVRGRITDNIENGLMQVQLAEMLAEETGCLHAPYHFADSFVKHAYLSGRNVQPNQFLYADTWGEVILMSGLPGTGKDTWIRQNCSDMPVVSLDEIRKEKGVSPTDNQGVVIQAAQEKAREHLRKKESFIWNATNLTRDIRQKIINLIERYGASVRIIYCETGWNERVGRNNNRSDTVPEGVVEKMLGKTVLPTPDEAQTVEWICV